MVKSGSKNRICRAPIVLGLIIAFQSLLLSQNLWQRTNGPFGGDVRTLTEDSTGRLWTGTSHGIYSSVDKGDTWDYVSGYFAPTNFVIDSRGVLYVTHYWGGFDVSTDHGKSWQYGSVVLPVFADVRSLIIDRQDRLFAATDQGIFRSEDNAMHWTSVSPAYDFSCIGQDATGQLYASAGDTIFWSGDNGNSWFRPDTMFATPAWCPVYGFGFTSQGEVFGSTIGGLVHSTNRGKSWEFLPLVKTFGVQFSAGRIIVDKHDRILVGTWDGLFISDPPHGNGRTWTQIDLGYRSTQCTALCLGVDGTVYAAIDQSLIVRLKDGDSTWDVAVTGMRDVSLTAIDIDAADNIVVGSNVGNIYFSTDRGEQWHAIYSLPSSASVTVVVWGRDGTIVAGTQGDGLFASKDRGRSWLARSGPGLFVRGFFMDRDGGYYLGANTQTLRSSDGGNSWTQVLNRGCAAFQQNQRGQLFGGGGQGFYRSDDGGKTWMPRNRGFLDSTITSIATDGNDLVFAGTECSGLYRSTDAGESWMRIKDDRCGSHGEPFPLTALGINADGRVFAAVRDSGFQRSSDNGVSWRTEDPWCGAKLVFDRNGFMFMIADGVYVSRGSTTTSVPTRDPSVPASVLLFQNYPNPFNPNSNIRYQVSELGNVRLAVYDLLGREVAVLVNETKAPGAYQVRFDANGLPSGVYFYRLQAGSYTETKQLLLVR